MPSATSIRTSTNNFLSALLSPNLDPPSLLKEHFTSSNPRITEHGPSWAQSRLPFLGRTFSGRDGCLDYFTQLSKVLKMDMDPWQDGAVIVDEKAGLDGESRGTVCVLGGGTFTAIETGKSWKEKFIYRLSNFDDAGKIGHWEVWADPLSAWEAVGGGDEEGGKVKAE